MLEGSGRDLAYLISSSGPRTLGSDGILSLDDNVYWSGGIPPRRRLVVIVAVLVLCRGFTVCTCLEETQTYEGLPKHIDHHVGSFTICSIVILGI